MPGRIPEALKNVFLASQTGVDVNTIEAPTDGVGFKVFNNRGLRKHVHTVVAHQKIPQPPMRAPRRSSLGMMRNDSSSNLMRNDSSSNLSYMSNLSSDSTASLGTLATSASLATSHHINEAGTKPKVCNHLFIVKD